MAKFKPFQFVNFRAEPGDVAAEPFPFLEVVGLAQKRDAYQLQSMTDSLQSAQDISTRMMAMKALLEGLRQKANQLEKDGGTTTLEEMEDQIRDFRDNWESMMDAHKGAITHDHHPFPDKGIFLDVDADQVHAAINKLRDLIEMEGYALSQNTQETKRKGDLFYVEGNVYEAQGRSNRNKSVDNQRTH